MACPDMFQVCPADMLPTQRPSPVVDVFNRPVSFQVWFVSVACCEVVSWYLAMTGQQVLPDKMVTV